MRTAIRTALPKDADFLADIERSAAERFRALPDLAWIADEAPTPVARHHALIALGTVWIAEEQDGPLVGAAMAEPVDGVLHLWELAVRYERQGRGIGSALLHAVSRHASRVGVKAVTLTTFRDVGWNAPFYSRMGFETLAGGAIDERLAGVLAREIADGLPANRRCAMRLAV